MAQEHEKIFHLWLFSKAYIHSFIVGVFNFLGKVHSSVTDQWFLVLCLWIFSDDIELVFFWISFQVYMTLVLGRLQFLSILKLSTLLNFFDISESFQFSFWNIIILYDISFNLHLRIRDTLTTFSACISFIFFLYPIALASISLH